MGRLTTSIALGLCTIGLIMGILLNAHEAPVEHVETYTEKPKDWKWSTQDGAGFMAVEDADFNGVATTQEVMTVHRNGEQFLDIVFFGKDGAPAVKLRSDGTVELLQEVDTATRAFWEAIAVSMPLCVKEQP